MGVCMKTFFSSFRLSVLAGGVLALGLFSACNKNDHNDSDVPVSGLMAFNLAPDVQQAGVALSGAVISNFLGFNSYTGGYISIYSGNRTVESYSNSGGTLATAPYGFEANKYYSLFVVGANNNYRNVIVTDNIDSLPATGQAFVRYINAIPDSSRPAVTISAGGSNVVNDNAAFASVSDFVAVTPGEVSISVSNGGTIDASRTITLEQRKVYTVLLSGIAGSANADSVQIKYIQNGTVDENAGRSASASGRSAN
jgi:hypothetical protein